MTGRFEDSVAVVTGAAQGIGEAYARALAAEGASVVVAQSVGMPGVWRSPINCCTRSST